MADHKLLEHRKKIKSKKPVFLRQDATRNKSLEKRWIKPKGMHSKMRQYLRGRRKSPSPGYSSPKKIRGLNREGFKEVLVKSTEELKSFDPKTQVVVIAHVGTKRKIEIIKVCLEKKYHLANLKNAQEFIQKIENKFAEKKKSQKEKEEKKTKSKEESLKKTEKKKEEEKKEEQTNETPVEETKKGEKSEKIKILEKKQ